MRQNISVKMLEKKSDFLSGVTPDLRSEFEPVVDKVMKEVVETAIMELHPV